MCDGNKNQDWGKQWGGLIILMGSITIFCLIVWRFCYNNFGADEALSWTVPVEVWFSGLAFAGVIYAIFLQRQELELQRKELRDTRKVFEGQREQMENQVEAMALQSEQSAFFQVLGYQQDRATNSSTTKIADSLKRTLRPKSSTADAKKEARGKMQNILNSNKLEHDLGPYFVAVRNTLQLLDRIKREELQDLLRGILSGTLSQDELFVLFFYGLTSEGEKSIKELIEKYHILEHLQRGIIPKEYLNRYESLRQA